MSIINIDVSSNKYKYNDTNEIICIIDIYEYTGPLVVLDMNVCIYAGEEDPSSFCPFCDGLYKRVNTHMRTTHRKKQAVKDIEALPTESEKTIAFDKLSRRRNFQHNIAAITARRGLVYPSRRSKGFRDNSKMIHCIKCFLYLERRAYNKHMKTCTERDDEAPGTLADATLQQGNM